MAIFQSAMAGVAFFYSAHLELQYQLLILITTLVVGTWAFIKLNSGRQEQL
jgi:UDP-N-acetylmuramyl pentapeptide phosphotransferase/UDP-N-acetylglucosamine-1-phosphate transferase